MEWVLGGMFLAVVIYVVLRMVWTWFLCGGNSGGNYYSDSEK